MRRCCRVFAERLCHVSDAQAALDTHRRGGEGVGNLMLAEHLKVHGCLAVWSVQHKACLRQFAKLNVRGVVVGFHSGGKAHHFCAGWHVGDQRVVGVEHGNTCAGQRRD